MNFAQSFDPARFEADSSSMRSPRRPAAAGVLGPPAGASSGSAQQLEYWIKQTSQLSDNLIESQMRASQAEAEAARLAPLEAQWPVLAAEARSLSEARADALVENARLAEWNEQLRLLGATQDQELQQLRRLLADKDAHCAQLQSQLSSAHSAHSAAASSMQLQQAYQSKLMEVESALADAQRKAADHSSLQFNYQVLHAKYEQLKKLRAGRDEGALEQQAQMQKLVQMNQAYQRQMEGVCHEVEKVRTDLLVREEERAALIEQVSTLSEQNSLYRSHVDKANVTIERLQHGMMVARTRLYQCVGKMREQQSNIMRECAFMLQQEQERTAALVAQLVAHVAQEGLRNRREADALHATLREDHLMHNLAMQQQERKLAQLMDFSTGTAATAAHLQRARHGTTVPLQQPPHVDAALLRPSPPASSAGFPAAGFDVRDWLSLQTLAAVPSPRPLQTAAMATSGAPAASAAAAAAPATADRGSLPSDSNFSMLHAHSHSAHRIPPASAAGQSPSAPPHPLSGVSLSSAALPPPTFSLPSSLASSIHPHRSAQQQPMPMHLQQHQQAAPHAQVQQQQQQHHYAQPASTLPPTVYAAPADFGRLQLGAVHPPLSLDPVGPPPPPATSAVPLTRNIHVQRLAEVEAALQAMSEM